MAPAVFVSQEPTISLLEIGLGFSNPVQRGCRKHLVIVSASLVVSASRLPFFFLSTLD